MGIEMIETMNKNLNNDAHTDVEIVVFKKKSTEVICKLMISLAKIERAEERKNLKTEFYGLSNKNVIFGRPESINDDIKILMENIVKKKYRLNQRLDLLRIQCAEMMNPADQVALKVEEEILKLALSNSNREEEALKLKVQQHELQIKIMFSKMKRVQEEDQSQFNKFPIFKNRYLMLNLLGKGGFGEVYKGYDLVDHKHVACKLQLGNPTWSNDVKKSFISHINKEMSIQRRLNHSNILRLVDGFKVDDLTACIILDFCSGRDLESKLIESRSLSEGKARLIVYQIVQGLVYMNKGSRKVIHYDLKPGNVMFDGDGVVKISDFGLSQIPEAGSDGIKLPPLGTGTHSYMAPECTDPKKCWITSKVDVWSLGRIFHRMLFGNLPQPVIEGRFPSTPIVSNEAKDFLRLYL